LPAERSPARAPPEKPHRRGGKFRTQKKKFCPRNFRFSPQGGLSRATGRRQGIGVYFFAKRKVIYQAIKIPWEGNDGEDKHSGFSAGCGFS
jgi:hypothetical protein